jgi:hypothetical protein
MGKYTHYFTLMYSVQSDDAEGQDISPDAHVARIAKRVRALYENNEIIEAVGLPDTEEN